MHKVIVSFLLCSQLCLAQHAWDKKPYPKWSAKEVNQLLSESPWAQMVTLGTTNMSMIGGGAGGGRRSGQASAMEMSLDAAHESTPRVSYQVQLRSAIPIRQAVARKAQLDAHYDEMPTDRKSAFDAKIGDYLAQNYGDVVVVQVAYSSNVPTYYSDVRRYWMGQTADQLKGSMYLNVAGKKLEPTSFVTGDAVFQVTFERSKEFDANSNLSLEFNNPQFGMIVAQRVLVQFQPKAMMFNGAMAF